MADFKKKVSRAIRLLQSIPQDGIVEVSYSGGKDSDCILELTKMAGIPYEAIYKNTTIDPPGTIKHAREMGATIVKPRQTFEEIITLRGFPNRFRRFCCSGLKEYKIKDRAIHGVRRDESTKRAARYKEPELCRLYEHGEKVRVYLPLLDWTNDDVERFIRERGIKCAPVYYDSAGCFHVERRLGCLCCPLMSINKRKEEFWKYPNMLKLYLRGGQKFMESGHGEKARERWGGDVYKYLMADLFVDRPNKNTLHEFNESLSGGLFPDQEIDAKQFLEDYFEVNLDI